MTHSLTRAGVHRRLLLTIVFAAAALFGLGLAGSAAGVCGPIGPPPTHPPHWQVIHRWCGFAEPDTLDLCPTTDTIRYCESLILDTQSGQYLYALGYDCLSCGGFGGGGGAGGPIEH